MARILLIDDDLNLLQMVKLMLERVGHQVMTSNTGDEGILLAAKAQPDLAIIDVMMPGLSGYDVVRKLRSDPVTVTIPVIILTARSQPMDKHMALEAGANAFLSKPVTAQELTDRVEAVMRAGVNYRVHTGLLTEPISRISRPDTPPGPGAESGTGEPVGTPAPGLEDDLPPARLYPNRTTPIPSPLTMDAGTTPDPRPSRPAPPGRKPIGADDIGKPTPVPRTPAAPPAPAPRTTTRLPIGAEDVVKSAEITPPTGRPPIITVISLRGGTGSTTVAVNLAALLSRSRRVCVADLSTAGGQVPLHLRLQVAKHWGLLLGQGDTPDAEAIKPLLVRHPQSGIAVLPAPFTPTAQTLSTAAAQHVLRELSTGFNQVIVDAGTLDAASVGALRASLAVVIVMTDDPPSIHATVQLLALLPPLGLDAQRVRVALNHVRPMPDIAAETIQKSIKRPLTVELPYDSSQISAMRRGVPLVLANPEGAFSVQLQQLALTIAV